jgi:hypothetical protein
MPKDPFNVVRDIAEAIKKYNDVTLTQQIDDLQEALLEMELQKTSLIQELQKCKEKLGLKQAGGNISI